AEIVLSHQERFDGQGYPRKLTGGEIHIGARIFSVADTLDAMTSDRPYRRGTTFANAIAEIVRCSGTQFDPEVVKAFLALGEKGLMQIKQAMQNGKHATVVQLDQTAEAAAEAELALSQAAGDDADMDVSLEHSKVIPLVRR